MVKFKNHYNSKPDKGEVNNKPSLTVPDQTMTIPEILRRYARGLPLNVGSGVAIYEGEEDPLEGIDFRKMDLSEQMDFVNSRLEAITERLNEAQAKQKEKLKLAEKEAIIKEYIEKNKTDINPEDIK